MDLYGRFRFYVNAATITSRKKRSASYCVGTSTGCTNAVVATVRHQRARLACPLRRTMSHYTRTASVLNRPWSWSYRPTLKHAPLASCFTAVRSVPTPQSAAEFLSQTRQRGVARADVIVPLLGEVIRTYRDVDAEGDLRCGGTGAWIAVVGTHQPCEDGSRVHPASFEPWRRIGEAVEEGECLVGAEGVTYLSAKTASREYVARHRDA